ncbi:MAG: FxLYD domain-containing protein [Candidatus Margulisbacteria bacterium]|nr:FxLYD domain-containing protein [Candidatus Margulisiibacteriota bacterium]
MKNTAALLLMIIVATISSSNSIAEVISEITQKDASGNPQEITFYENNKIIAHKFFDEFGKAKEVAGNIPDGLVSRYYSEGKLELLVQYKGNKRNGKQIVYYENGNIKNDCYLKDDLFDGIQNTYNEYGDLQSTTNYVAGKKNGTIKIFDKGVLQLVGDMKDDKPDGLFTKYYPNGQKEIESNYKEDKIDGTMRTYYTDGHLQWEINYRNGIIDGYSRYYDADGVLLKEEYYNKGVKIAERKRQQEKASTAKSKTDIIFDKTLKSSLERNRHIDILSHRAITIEPLGIPAIVGEVQNNTEGPATIIEITVTYYDKNGNILDTGSTFSDPLEVKGKTPFEIVNLNKTKYDHYGLKATLLL